MQFSYFNNITNFRPVKPYIEVINNAREISQFADQSGFSCLWLSEHHISNLGNNGFMEVLPNPTMMCLDIANRTKNIKVGTAANIITFHSPLTLAEDIALLDNLTDGRIEISAGRGVFNIEAVHNNAVANLTDQAQNFRLFEETLSVMRKAWYEEYFCHKGEFYEYPVKNFQYRHPMADLPADVIDPETKILKKISVVPKPLGKINLHQVVDSVSSIEFAAKNDMGALMWLPTLKSLKKRFEAYQAAKSEAEGRQVPLGQGITLVKDTYVASSMAEAEDLAGEYVMNYYKWITAGGRGIDILADPGEEFPKKDGKSDTSILDYKFLHPRNLLFGTPEYIIEKIHELKSELGLQNLAIWSNHPGQPHELTMKSLKLFRDKVMPHFMNDSSGQKKAS